MDFYGINILKKHGKKSLLIVTNKPYLNYDKHKKNQSWEYSTKQQKSDLFTSNVKDIERLKL